MTQVTLKDVLDLNKQIYDEIKDLGNRIEKVEARTSVLENFKAEVMGKMAVAGAFVIVVVNLFIEWIKERFIKA